MLACVAVSALPAEPRSITAILQSVADRISQQYNTSVAAAFRSSSSHVEVASGHTDAGLGMGVPLRRAEPGDPYVWGSITKMFTAPAVLQLVEKGVVSLDDRVATHVDPMLRSRGTTFAAHYGIEAARLVKIEHLLHMTSGIRDYDRAAYTDDQFANRSRDFDPLTIVLEYSRRPLEFEPGTAQRYCSTNYVLLGLVLATHLGGLEAAATSLGAPSWQSYDQMSVLPPSLVLRASRFVDAGTCESVTPVHGFTAGYSTATLAPQDVWNVSCVGGWTAGNYVGSVGDLAAFTYALYSAGAVVGAASRARMINFTAPNSERFYGMGTFYLGWSVGPQTEEGGVEAYGHVGDTYGYQSQTTYVPAQDFVLSVATNVETTSQAQPADFTCSAYNEIVAALHGKPAPHCTFTVPYHFIGTCECATPGQAVVEAV